MRLFEKKYKNTVVEWEGHVMRVDGDHREDDDIDSDLQIGDAKHYYSHASAEVFVRMNPPLKGLFRDSDYDLLLVLDSEHFQRNTEALDMLKVGSDIKFKGFLKNLGGVSEQFGRKSLISKPQKVEDKGEKLMPWFTAFDINVVKQIDELPTQGQNRQGHHHLHENMRYSVKSSQSQEKDKNS